MPEKILVVDDEPDTVSLLAYTLTRAGYSVLKAHDGRSCLATVAAEAPDLIILDVMMPDMDGLQVLQALRQSGQNHAPVVFFTAKGRAEDVLAAMEAGAFHYLVKPTSRDKLLETVRAALADRRDPHTD